MSDEPQRLASRLVDVCVGVLLAAMALYGAVAIIRATWLYLCVISAVFAVSALLWWWINTRYRGW